MSFRLQSNAAQISAQLQRRASALVRATAFGIEGDIKTSMAEPKSGHIYGNHQASAPGESPAIDTGQLANSIQTVVEELSATVGTNTEYAPYLEFGTHRMAPRPFMGPAFERAKPEFEKGLKELVK